MLIYSGRDRIRLRRDATPFSNRILIIMFYDNFRSSLLTLHPPGSEYLHLYHDIER